VSSLNPDVGEYVQNPNEMLLQQVAQGGLVGNWNPAIGTETMEFLERCVPSENRTAVSRSSVNILAKGVPPTQAAGQETGLVVGYVQSGKTMSFEAVATLARDNGFHVVIVVTGTSNPLLDQSTGRLRRDLRLDEPGRERRWIQFENPSADDPTVHAFRDVLDDWRDPGTPEEFKKTVLITVLKHYGRLRNLTQVLRTAGMQGVPALVIDDEADQASLNTEVNQGQESSTYHELCEMRRILTNHTYLQYTATPQAPLLVNIIDSLSPNFVHVLEPGVDYVGGLEFFREGSRLIQVIPSQDVPTNTNPLGEPPPSLIAALRFFMVGVTVGIRLGGNAGNRSMLVHPSHLTAQHEEYYNWVRDILEEWKRLLALPNGDRDREELIEDLRDSYAELTRTVDDVPAFDDLEPTFRFAFRNTRLQEMNARGGRTPQIDWRSAYGWILVGGQAMDRGFTVEGLTVTYMPRGIGVGNADTVQQRARFFGYKRRYLGYCRVYLEQGTVDAFRNYVEHEEDMRQQLTEYANSGQSLDQWKRAFILDLALKPCRANVIEYDYIRGRFADAWVSPRVVLSSIDVAQANAAVVRRFVESLQLIDNAGHPERTAAQRHRICTDVPLRHVVGELLVGMRITGTTDSQRNTGMLLQLSRASELNPDERCTVYVMSPSTRRQRGVDDHGEITNLFQGASPVHPRERRGEVYPGDQALHEVETVTVQIHNLDLIREENGETKTIMQGVPVVAVWIPARLAVGWLQQEQANRGGR